MRMGCHPCLVGDGERRGGRAGWGVELQLGGHCLRGRHETTEGGGEVGNLFLTKRFR